MSAMNISLFLAKRFITHKQKRGFFNSVSLITIAGIAIGVTVVTLALTILDGFENVVAEKIVEFNSHLKVTGFGNRNLSEFKAASDAMKKNFGKELTSIEPFVTKLAIVKSRRNSDGINLTGITNSFAKSSFKKFIINGSYQLQGDQSILVGKYLARKLAVNVGDKITVFCLRGNKIPSEENPPEIEQFTVSGIFESGISEYDDGNAFINFTSAQEIFGMHDEVSGFNINVRDLSKLNKTAEALQDFLGYPFFVRTIYQVHQNIFTWIDLQKKPIPIVLGLIIVVAVFNIVGTMLMIVLERINQIGVLRSIGMRRTTILRTFMIHSAYIIGWGLMSGILLSLLLSWLQMQFNIITLPEKIYFITSVPITIELKNYLIVSVVTITVSAISSFIPALIASRIKPISAIRFE